MQLVLVVILDLKDKKVLKAILVLKEQQVHKELKEQLVLKDYKAYRLEAALEARDAEIKRIHQG